VAADEVRAYVASLLDGWESGERLPRDVFAEARASWFSGRWPRSFERGHDADAMAVLYFLASARDMGLDDPDAPVLRAYLADPRRDRAGEHLMSFWEASGEAREALAAREDYYGPPPDDGVDDMEADLSDPDDRRLHRLVRTDPEAGWDELRARLCAPPPRDDLFLEDLIEDLMFNDADAFIDRIEGLITECPQAREPVAAAYVDGHASTPGLERFWSLQERLRPK
jgi:hypothetical protein